MSEQLRFYGNPERVPVASRVENGLHSSASIKRGAGPCLHRSPNPVCMHPWEDLAVEIGGSLQMPANYFRPLSALLDPPIKLNA